MLRPTLCQAVAPMASFRALALALCLAPAALALPLSPAAADGHRRLPVAVAHRGASGAAPENTMASLRLAHELGAAGFETDLHMTADGVIVLLHDADIRRTTRGWPDGLPVRLWLQALCLVSPVSNYCTAATIDCLQSYNIGQLDWAFIATLDAGSWFSPEVCSFPTFDRPFSHF